MHSIEILELQITVIKADAHVTDLEQKSCTKCEILFIIVGFITAPEEKEIFEAIFTAEVESFRIVPRMDGIDGNGEIMILLIHP